jgi:hypothetical protein
MGFSNSRALADDSPGVVGMPFTPDWPFRRLAAIEGETAPVDPWGRVSEDAFAISPETLLSRAARSRPSSPGATVSAFTEWIYSLYLKDLDTSALRQGKEAEGDIDWQRLSTSKPDFRNLPGARWQLLHCGIGDPQSDLGHPVFTIPALTINGVPLRGCPDLVFRNEVSGEVALIEVKFTLRIVPRNLWPNVWAQLWAYSKIPQFAASGKITAVGEVWGDNMGAWSRDNLESIFYLRHCVRRDPRAPAYDRFFRNLFHLYGGQIAE